MAKKPLETGAPEASAAKKTAARKTTAKKTASTTKKAAAAEKKAVVDAASVEAPKTKIKTVKSAPKTAVKTKTAKTAKKAADEKAPVSETVVAPSEAPAPSAPVEKEMMPEAPQKPQAAAPVKVKRESFRPNRNAEQQERHEQHGGDVFAQPETVGGASEGPLTSASVAAAIRKAAVPKTASPCRMPLLSSSWIVRRWLPEPGKCSWRKCLKKALP